MGTELCIKLYPFEDAGDLINGGDDFKLAIEYDTNDLIVYTDQKEAVYEPVIFSLSISKNGNVDISKMIFATMTINDLELFAKSITEQVKQVRRNYKKQLTWQYKNRGKP